jgi:hypothetical protein
MGQKYIVFGCSENPPSTARFSLTRLKSHPMGPNLCGGQFTDIREVSELFFPIRVI